MEAFIEKMIAEGEYVDMADVYTHLQIPNLRQLELARTAQNNDRFIRESIKFYVHCTEIRSFSEMHDYVAATLSKFLKKPITSFEDIGMGWLSGHKSVRALFGLDDFCLMRDKHAWPKVSDGDVLRLAVKFVRSQREDGKGGGKGGKKLLNGADEVAAMYRVNKERLLNDPELDAKMNAYIREGLRLKYDLRYASHVGICVDAKGLIHRMCSHFTNALAQNTTELSMKIEHEFTEQVACDFRQQLVHRVRGFVIGAGEGGLVAATERCLSGVDVDLQADYRAVQNLLAAAPDFATFTMLALGALDLAVVPSGATSLSRAEAGDSEVCECLQVDAAQLVAFFCRSEDMDVRGSVPKQSKMGSVTTFYNRLHSVLLALVVTLSLRRAEESRGDQEVKAAAMATPLSKSKPRSQRKAAQVETQEEELRQAIDAKIRSFFVNHVHGVPEFCMKSLCDVLSDATVVDADAFIMSRDLDAAQERDCTMDLQLLLQRFKLHHAYTSKFSRDKKTGEIQTRHTISPRKVLALITAAFIYRGMVQSEQKSLGADAAEALLEQQVPSFATEAVSEALRGVGSDPLGIAEVSELVFGSLRRLESRLLIELRVPAMECLHRGSTLQYLLHRHPAILQRVLETALAKMPHVAALPAEGGDPVETRRRAVEQLDVMVVDLEMLLGTVSRALDDASEHMRGGSQASSADDAAAVVFKTLHRVEEACKRELDVAHFEQATPGGLSFLGVLEHFGGFHNEEAANDKCRELRGASSEFMRSLQLNFGGVSEAAQLDALAVEDEAEAWMAAKGHLAEIAVLQAIRDADVQGGGRDERTAAVSSVVAQRFSLSMPLVRRLTDMHVTALLERDRLVIKAGSLVVTHPRAAPLILLDPTLPVPMPVPLELELELANKAKSQRGASEAEERAVRVLASVPLGHSAAQAALWSHHQANIGGAPSLLRFVANHEQQIRVLRPDCVFFATNLLAGESAGDSDAILLPTSFALPESRDVLQSVVDNEGDAAALGAYCSAAALGLIPSALVRTCLKGIFVEYLGARSDAELVELCVGATLSMPVCLQRRAFFVCVRAALDAMDYDLVEFQKLCVELYQFADCKHTLLRLVAIALPTTWSSQDAASAERLDVFEAFASKFAEQGSVEGFFPRRDRVARLGYFAPTPLGNDTTPNTLRMAPPLKENRTPGIDGHSDGTEVANERRETVHCILRERYKYTEDPETGLLSPPAKSDEKDGMLQKTIEALGQQLYSEQLHFVMELIQNADDNEYPPGVVPSLSMELDEGQRHLLVRNNECGFSEGMLQSRSVFTTPS